MLKDDDMLKDAPTCMHDETRVCVDMLCLIMTSRGTDLLGSSKTRVEQQKQVEHHKAQTCRLVPHLKKSKCKFTFKFAFRSKSKSNGLSSSLAQLLLAPHLVAFTRLKRSICKNTEEECCLPRPC